eukprot:6190500-Pleurochrysis_carterae.AAC.2
MIPQQVLPKYRTSADNPLCAPNTGSWPSDQKRNTPAPQPSGVAGRPAQRSIPMGAVLNGSSASADARPVVAAKRTEYMHPSYNISRSLNGSGAKDLLYPEPPPEPAQQEHNNKKSSDLPDGVSAELVEVYKLLKDIVPRLPRDDDGCLDEHRMHSVLEVRCQRQP